MTQQPKVSVIVPVYGVEKQLPRCIESLLAQTYEKIEILLVDDGSRDASGRICDDYAAKDERIKVLHKENGGVSSARNLGLSAITGEYLLFLDGDDALEPNTIKACLDAATDGNYDLVCFGYQLFLEEKNGNARFLQNDARKARIVPDRKTLLKEFTKLSSLGLFDFVTDKLFRVSCLKEKEISFDSYFDMGGEDGVFMLDLLPHVNSLCVLPDCFYRYYRREGESVTVSFREGKFDRYHARAARLYGFMQKEDCLDFAYLADLYATYILWMYNSLFSPTCGLSYPEKCRFLRTGFEKPALFPDFAATLKKAVREGAPKGDYSANDRRVLRAIVSRKKIFAWFLFTLTTFKNGGFRRAKA